MTDQESGFGQVPTYGVKAVAVSVVLLTALAGCAANGSKAMNRGAGGTGGGEGAVLRSGQQTSQTTASQSVATDTKQPPIAGKMMEPAPIPAEQIAQAAHAPTFVMSPGASMSSYTHVAIEPVGMILSQAANPGAISADDLGLIAETMRTRLTETLGESLIVSEVGGGTGAAAADSTSGGSTGGTARVQGNMTLLVRATIARLMPRVDPSAPTGFSGVTLRAGACRFELIDGGTGQTVATFVDASTPSRLAARGSRTDAELTDACVRTWAELLAQRVEKGR